MAKPVTVSPSQQEALRRIEEADVEYIIGIDEVGLGPWAGPVTVGAVVVPKGWRHHSVRDSKQLSAKARLAATRFIYDAAVAHCVISSPVEDIDKYGLKKAHALVTEGAALYCLKRYPDALIVQDGDIPVTVDGRPQKMVWLPKADVLVPAVSAASIIAKLNRDAFMTKAAKEFPGYGFAQNKGYGTSQHIEGLKKHGVCSLHRKSYKPVKRFLESGRL